MTEFNRLKAKDKGVCGVWKKSLYKAMPSRSFISYNAKPKSF